MFSDPPTASCASRHATVSRKNKMGVICMMIYQESRATHKFVQWSSKFHNSCFLIPHGFLHVASRDGFSQKEDGCHLHSAMHQESMAKYHFVQWPSKVHNPCFLIPPRRSRVTQKFLAYNKWVFFKYGGEKWEPVQSSKKMFYHVFDTLKLSVLLYCFLLQFSMQIRKNI